MILNYSQPLEVTNLTSWLDATLRSNLSEFWVLLIEFVLVGIAFLAAYAVIALILIYAERKITAFFQARYGPNRVGKWGWLQSVADMVKILLKEIVKITRSDRFLFEEGIPGANLCDTANGKASIVSSSGGPR